jgi:hypothetical protein
MVMDGMESYYRLYDTGSYVCVVELNDASLYKFDEERFLSPAFPSKQLAKDYYDVLLGRTRRLLKTLENGTDD